MKLFYNFTSADFPITFPSPRRLVALFLFNLALCLYLKFPIQLCATKHRENTAMKKMKQHFACDFLEQKIRGWCDVWIIDWAVSVMNQSLSYHIISQVMFAVAIFHLLSKFLFQEMRTLENNAKGEYIDRAQNLLHVQIISRGKKESDNRKKVERWITLPSSVRKMHEGGGGITQNMLQTLELSSGETL